MSWLKVSVAVGLVLFLPLTAPAITTQFTVPLPTIEKTTYVYDADFVQVASDNALTESKSSGDSASLFGPLAGLVAAESPSAFESMLQKVDTLNFSTPRNGAVFYSGPGQGARATAFAERTGGMTIEMTPGGRYLSENLSGFTRAQQDLIWQRASTPFAEGASGRINAFIKGADPSRTFRTIEEPLLDLNSDVIRSIYHY